MNMTLQIGAGFCLLATVCNLFCFIVFRQALNIDKEKKNEVDIYRYNSKEEKLIDDRVV